MHSTLRAWLRLPLVVAAPFVGVVPHEAAEPRLRPRPPEEVRGIAEVEIAERTGLGFFRDNVRFIPERSSYQEARPDCVHRANYSCSPYYLLIWHYTIPDMPAVDLVIEAHVDVHGRPVTELADRFLNSIPKCAKEPQRCLGFISASAARSAARAAGLAEGVRPWGIGFYWDQENPGCFVWQLTNTIAYTQEKSHGEVMKIDANTGAVRWHGGWFKD